MRSQQQSKQRLLDTDPHKIVAKACEVIQSGQRDRFPKLYQFVLNNDRYDFFYDEGQVKAVILNSKKLSSYQIALAATKSQDELLIDLAQKKLEAIAIDESSMDSKQSISDLAEMMAYVENKEQLDELRSTPGFTSDRLNRACQLLPKEKQKYIRAIALSLSSKNSP